MKIPPFLSGQAAPDADSAGPPVSFTVNRRPALLEPRAATPDATETVFAIRGAPLRLELAWQPSPESAVIRWRPTLCAENSAPSLPRIGRVRIAELRIPNTDPAGATAFRSIRGGTCPHRGNERFPTPMFRIEDRALFGLDIFRYFDDTGRCSNEYLPIWVFAEAGRGFWLAPEWCGCWCIEVHRLPEYTSVFFELPQLDFVPRPGERIELPAVTLGRFDGGVEDGSNHFRRYASEHCVPPFRGEQARPRAMFQIFGGPRENMGEPTVHDEVKHVAELGLETFTYASTWQYDNDPQGRLHWWNLMGDYRPAQGRFPDGMAALRRDLTERGLDPGLWIDPRIGLDNPLVKDPEVRRNLLFYDPAYDPETSAKYNPVSYDINIQPLINLAAEGGRELFAGLLERMVAEYGAKMIWFDMNCDPRPFFFDVHETGDRRGLLELGFYQGFDRVMAEFRSRHPDVWIEICASGGRILSLASLKAGHSHWITDYTGHDPDIAGAILTGANSILPSVCNHQSWYPDHSAHTDADADANAFLANFAADLSFAPELYALPSERRQRLRECVAIWREHQALLQGDFHLLRPRAETRTGIEAWQTHSPEYGGGLVCLRWLAEADPSVPVVLTPQAFPSGSNPAFVPIVGEADIRYENGQLRIALTSGRACLLRYRCS